MKVLNSGNIIRLALDAVQVEGRLRQVSEAQVQNLLLMAEDTGITTPIHVRRVKGQHVLIDGAHRLAAAKQRGDADIAALVVECRADEARAMEASNNLGAARMSPLQTAVFVASWKRDFYEMHPDRKPGVFKGNQYSGKVVEELSSLTTSMAQAFGITDRWARKILAAGERLTSEEATLLDAAPERVGIKDLVDLAKVGEPEDRARIVALLHGGKASKVAQALRQIKAPKDAAAPVKDPVEEGFKTMVAVWSRMSEATKRRFLAGIEPEAQKLLSDIRDRKVINLRLGKPEADEAGDKVLSAHARRFGGATE
jgi:ParB family chromosome partitioning protein